MVDGAGVGGDGEAACGDGEGAEVVDGVDCDAVDLLNVGGVAEAVADEEVGGVADDGLLVKGAVGVVE